jgi:acyl carrier protein
LSSTTLIDAGIAEQRLVRELRELLFETMSIQVESSRQDLFQSGLLDSANMVQLLLHLEKRFGLRLPMEEVGAESFRSIDEMAGLIAGRKRGDSNGFDPPAAAQPAGRDETVRIIQGLFLDKMAIRVDSVDADLFETGIFDSMTLVEFIVHLEQHFGLRFPMQDLELDSVLSITKLSELVAHAQASAASGGGF